jgi:triosephosphate isomerase
MNKPMGPPARRRIIGVSTKLYFSAAKTESYIRDVVSQLRRLPTPLRQRVDVFIIPDLVTLSASIAQLRSLDLDPDLDPALEPAQPTAPILVGAQDTFWQDAGAYTGAVSPAVLREVGTRLVEIGHAERRRLFGETDVEVARKAAAVVRNGMVPLLCVGEPDAPSPSADGTGAQHQAGLSAVQFVEKQVAIVLAAVDALNPEAEVAIAYEPVWAIGAAQPAGEEHIVAVARGLRAADCVRTRRGVTRILYGGSAGPGLFAKLEGAVDGLFLGRFAHDPAQFCQTIREVAEA